MSVSDIVLSIVALRLAALLLAGVAIDSLPASPSIAAASASRVTVQPQPRDRTREDAAALLRDMLLHD